MIQIPWRKYFDQPSRPQSQAIVRHYTDKAATGQAIFCITHRMVVSGVDHQQLARYNNKPQDFNVLYHINRNSNSYPRPERHHLLLAIVYPITEARRFHLALPGKDSRLVESLASRTSQPAESCGAKST